jgi:hypothetical protein
MRAFLRLCQPQRLLRLRFLSHTEIDDEARVGSLSTFASPLEHLAHSVNLPVNDQEIEAMRHKYGGNQTLIAATSREQDDASARSEQSL